MCTLDERTVEYVAEESMASPRLMASVMRFNATEQRIRERCGVLTDAGLIAPTEMYEATEEGQRYLGRDLDEKHQPRLRIEG